MLDLNLGQAGQYGHVDFGPNVQIGVPNTS